jgi:hypothetical protein
MPDPRTGTIPGEQLPLPWRDHVTARAQIAGRFRCLKHLRVLDAIGGCDGLGVILAAFSGLSSLRQVLMKFGDSVARIAFWKTVVKDGAHLVEDAYPAPIINLRLLLSRRRILEDTQFAAF